MSDPVGVRRGAEVQHLSLPELSAGVSTRELPRYPSVAQIDTLRQQAQSDGRKAGFDAGYAEGLEAGRREAQDERQRLRELIDQAANALSVLDEAVLERLTELAVAIARGIVAVSIRERPDQLLEAARQGVALLVDQREPTRLYANPEDLPVLKPWADATKLALIPDKSVSAGGCVIESGYSRVDATVEARLARVTEQLLAAAPVVDLDRSAGPVPGENDESIAIE